MIQAEERKWQDTYQDANVPLTLYEDSSVDIVMLKIFDKDALNPSPAKFV